jgi:phosphate transport system substrate-binding protein
MLKVKNLALLAVVALLISVSAVFAQDGTIVDVAAGSEDFSTLVELVTAAGLAETLAGEGPFTVFAPTNDAFAALPAFAVDYLIANPDVLTRVLTYHVIPGAVMAADVSTMMAATVEGGELNVVVGDMGVMVNNANVTATDIAASNGVIHVIDTVLIPDIELPEIIPADVQGDIITAGSSTVAPLSNRIVSDFAAEGYTGNASVESIGSGAGLERFCVAGDTDVANASRPINEEELASCAALDPARNPIEFRVGTDALAVVVNPANDFLTDVTTEQLATIFSTAVNWSDVDPSWPAEPIIRYIPGTDSGTFDYFVEEILDEDTAPILAASNLNQSEDDNVLEQGVAGNQFAIGFFGYAYYAANQDELKILSIDGVEANQANVDNNSYSLARPLFIYSDAGIIAEKPQVGQFVTYYLNRVNDVIVEVGYFPANEYALRAAKLFALAATSMGMM